MSKRILGISAWFHDAAACLLVDGKIIAAAEEERFSRKKHDPSLPLNAIRYCLAEAGIEDSQLDAVVFYDKPILKFHRILESFLCVAPSGLKSFVKVMPNWLREKLWLPPALLQALDECGIKDAGQLYFCEHHESHAASAFYPSPFEEAAILTIDGVGEWASATIGYGNGNKMELIKELEFPHSLGMLYSAFTYFTGFKVNSGEYKLMGLAPYGEPVYRDTILNELLDLKDDGSFRLNMDYFSFLDEQVMVNEAFNRLFDGPPRQPETPFTRREMDIARSIQEVTEEIVLRMATHAKDVTGSQNLCLAGGVALNCVANGKLATSGLFEHIWVQPAAADAGGALGAALSVHHNEFAQNRTARDNIQDDMQGSLLGPVFSDTQIQDYLDSQEIDYEKLDDENRAITIAQLTEAGNVIGLFDGRMEFGPRALGNRSIIADPRNTTMQATLNQKIKFRESFRPFAASVLKERVSDYFDFQHDTPYMLMVAKLRNELRHSVANDREQDIYQRANTVRSELPAITHTDYSCRLQSVDNKTNPRYYQIIKAFEAITGCGMVINTSFNVRGEPIVCTPSEAWRCFMRTNMDYLVLGSFLLKKNDSARLNDTDIWD